MRSSARARAAVGAAGLYVASVLTIAATSGATAITATDRLHTSPASTALPAVARAVEAARRGAPIPAKLVPPLATIKLFPRRYRIPYACIGHNASAKATSRVCRVGRTSSEKLVVLMGDSHAFMWLPAVLEMARRDGWAVVPLIRFGCTPGKWFGRLGSAACREWYGWSTRQIRRLRPAVTLLGGSIPEEPSAVTRAATSGMIAAAQRLRALGPLVVIGDPEGLALDPVRCVLRPHASMSSCTTTWAPAALAAYDRVAGVTTSMRVGFLPTRGFVCHQRQCPAVVGRTIVWMDNSHLTGIYSAQLAGPFRAAFLRATR